MPAPTPTIPSASSVKASAMPQFDPSILADIHLPESISFWPVANGWWILLAAAILLMLLFSFMSYLKRGHSTKKTLSAKQLKILTMKELALIEKAYETDASPHETIKQLSIFLRRFSLSQYDREAVASLTDQQWLVFLDNMLSTDQNKQDNPFSNHFAELLIHAPYQAADNPLFDKEKSSAQIEALFRLIKTLIKTYKKPVKEAHHV